MDWTLTSIMLPMLFGYWGATNRLSLFKTPSVIALPQDPVPLRPTDPQGDTALPVDPVPIRPFFGGLIGGLGAILVVHILGQNVTRSGFFPLVLTAFAAGFVTTRLVREIFALVRKT